MLYPLINRRSLLSVDNKLILVKVIFQSIMLFACPAWGDCAAMHLKKLQIMQNKILKMALDLPWYYSTKRLHERANVSEIQNRIQMLNENFVQKCRFSDNHLITSLV